MKLLILDQFSEPGGAQLCLQDLAPEITRRGWDATFMAPGEGGIFGALARAGIRGVHISGFEYTNGRKTLRDAAHYGFDILRVMWAARRTVSPDLVYINGPRLLPAAMAFSCPVVFHAHSHPGRRYPRLIAAACLRMTRARVIAASRFAGQSLEGSRVIYSGVADLGFRVRARRPMLRVGIIGRIAPEKGQFDFVRAAAQLSNRWKNVDFVVCGAAMFSEEGYEQRVRHEAEGLPVRFCGWTRDVATALEEIDILTVPSGAGEAAGRVVMEGLSAGTPVVAYRSGGIPELICHERTGLLTEQRTPASLAASIERLLENPGLATRIAKEGRREWQSRFRVERFQQEVCDFLEVAAGWATQRQTFCINRALVRK